MFIIIVYVSEINMVRFYWRRKLTAAILPVVDKGLQTKVCIACYIYIYCRIGVLNLPCNYVNAEILEFRGQPAYGGRMADNVATERYRFVRTFANRGLS